MNAHAWEFLIQKEGDQDWLVLESPTAEILEGRYRMMAQSIFPDMAIEIQVSHICEQEGSGVPKRLYQRRANRSNSTGMVGLVSFTHMTAGIWKFSCRATQDPELELAGADASVYTWPGSIQLLVHPHSALADAEYEWDGGESVAVASGNGVADLEPTPTPFQPLVTSDSVNLPAPEIPEPAEELIPVSTPEISVTEALPAAEAPIVQPEIQPTAQPITLELDLDATPDVVQVATSTHVDNEIELVIAEPAQPVIPQAEPVIHSPAVPATDIFKPETPIAAVPLINLEDYAFTLAKGSILALTGQVLVDSDLIVQLRDPSNKNLVWQEHLALAGSTTELPRRFECQITPPANYGFLVGEVKLAGVGYAFDVESDAEAALLQEPDLCNQQTFLVTLMEPDLVGSAPSEPAPTPESRRRSIQLPVFDLDLPPLNLQVVQGPSLPPRLNPRPQVKPAGKSVELPTLKPQIPSTPEAAIAEPNSAEVAATEAPPADDFAALRLDHRFLGILNSLANPTSRQPSRESASETPLPTPVLVGAGVAVSTGSPETEQANRPQARSVKPTTDLDLPNFLN